MKTALNLRQLHYYQIYHLLNAQKFVTIGWLHTVPTLLFLSTVLCIAIVPYSKRAHKSNVYVHQYSRGHLRTIETQNYNCTGQEIRGHSVVHSRHCSHRSHLCNIVQNNIFHGTNPYLSSFISSYSERKDTIHFSVPLSKFLLREASKC